MADAIWNAVLVARQVLGIEEPKVAVMSFTEIMIDSSGVCFAKKLADYTRSKYSEDNIPFLIEGPLSYDVAVSMLSARNKGAGNRPVAGRADVLFFPEIDASNVLYKVWQVSGFPTASVILGARKPMALVSRSDPAETKLSTIAACSCYLGDVKKECQLIGKQFFKRDNNTS
jgi:phosphate butyryltransferase